MFAYAFSDLLSVQSKSAADLQSGPAGDRCEAEIESVTEQWNWVISVPGMSSLTLTSSVAQISLVG